MRNNLSTDLTIGDLVDIGLHFKDMSNTDIITYSYSDSCSGANCLPGSYLYVPVKANFDNQWVLLPDGATKSRLSKYDEMRKFATLIFQFPHLKDESVAIHIVTNKKNLSKARLIRQNLQQLGFPLNYSETIIQTGTTIPNSQVHAYFNKETNEGFSDESTLIKALKQVDENISYTFSAENLYAENPTPVIEIILGDDAKDFFKFTPSTITTATTSSNTTTKKTTGTGSTGSGSTSTGSITSTSTGNTTKTETTKTEAAKTENIQKLPSEDEKPVVLPSEGNTN